MVQAATGCDNGDTQRTNGTSTTLVPRHYFR